MDHRDEVLRRRAEMLAAFRDGRRSPYATVARHDLIDGRPLIFGSAEECDVRLEGLAPRQARLLIEGDRFLLETLADGNMGNSERKPPGARVSLGRYVLKLSHQNFPAVLVLDPESPEVRTGPLPKWFDYDDAWRVQAHLVEDAPQREQVIQSTRGDRRRALRLGFLEAELPGKPVRLLALRLLEPGVDEAAVSIFFRDRTSGQETYPVGRYVDPLPAEGAPGSYLLDFNRAYNPACAFSPHYNCPIPPRENQLDIEVRAGEKSP